MTDIPSEIAARLDALAEDMIDIGTMLNYYGGFNPYALEKSREIIGEAEIARQWAREIRKEEK